ncbi:glycosyltransferase [Azoarcus olearius]|uniref:Glycosyltransferase n=1 Tax=Azoarcus sp. (strain BH72) TaxID=418699 RepID=A1KAL8_AZOSB|nr:glycosyltransferase [Azoarcus olearius]CAL95874.1 glycosyltransferase [Azoarcus olearius]
MHRFSLIVCTRNRAGQLAPCLDAIARMEKPKGFELVVVDNASTDATQSVLAEFAAEVSFPVRVATEPKKGLGNARNKGWSSATGEIVAFTDDDCYVAHDFAMQIDRIFAEDAHLGFLGGRICLYDPDDLPLTILESTAPRRFPPGEVIAAGAIQGANIAFRRKALETTGGFDPLLGAGTPFPCEDIEIMGRLCAEGWLGCYRPEPVVHHHHGRKTAADAEQLERGYDHGRGAFYATRLLCPGTRRQYLRHWYWTILKQPLARTWRELRGAIGYSLAYAVHRERYAGSRASTGEANPS